MRPAPQPRPAARLALSALLLLAAPVASIGQDKPDAAALKPYTETIAGTDLKFDMLPIPGGTFTLGSPASEAKRKADEGPQVTGSRLPRSGWANVKSPGTSSTNTLSARTFKRKQSRERRPRRTAPAHRRRRPTPSPDRPSPMPT